jgi:hypothetical protein
MARVASRRSLQRKLNGWQRKGLVRAVGIRRGRRYLLAPPLGPAAATAVASVTATLSSTNDDGVTLSTAGRELRAIVKRPMADRAPIGYQREFLDGYTPGVTQYLMESLRRHLRELGRTPDDQRPAGTYARDILNRLLIDLSWSSSRLEGNTYSLLDTKELIEHGNAAPGKDAKETQMILNHKAAIELLVDSAEEIDALAVPLVLPEDLEHFRDLVLVEIARLHEGNIARFRVRPNEFRLWRSR